MIDEAVSGFCLVKHASRGNEVDKVNKSRKRILTPRAVGPSGGAEIKLPGKKVSFLRRKFCRYLRVVVGDTLVF